MSAASNTAFEIALGTTAADGSPPPQGGSVGRSITPLGWVGAWFFCRMEIDFRFAVCL
jgi:hypothetical protein